MTFFCQNYLWLIFGIHNLPPKPMNSSLRIHGSIFRIRHRFLLIASSVSSCKNQVDFPSLFLRLQYHIWVWTGCQSSELFLLILNFWDVFKSSFFKFLAIWKIWVLWSFPSFGNIHVIFFINFSNHFFLGAIFWKIVEHATTAATLFYRYPYLIVLTLNAHPIIVPCFYNFEFLAVSS